MEDEVGKNVYETVARAPFAKKTHKIEGAKSSPVSVLLEHGRFVAALLLCGGFATGCDETQSLAQARRKASVMLRRSCFAGLLMEVVLETHSNGCATGSFLTI